MRKVAVNCSTCGGLLTSLVVAADRQLTKELSETLGDYTRWACTACLAMVAPQFADQGVYHGSVVDAATLLRERKAP